MIAREIESCRACGSGELSEVLNLGYQALSGRFPGSREEEVPGGPLVLAKCTGNRKCGLVQLKHSYNLDELYGDQYGYRSGLNKSMVQHLEQHVKRLLDLEFLAAGDPVIDIGSNDGTTLNCFPENEFQLIGVDPSSDKFASYYRDDIARIADFFPSNAVDEELSGKQAKLITSISMFYDLEDPQQFVNEISRILAPDGLWLFEQSYLPSMLNSNSFDTVCHEHLEYYSIKQVEYLLQNAGLAILDVGLNAVNGGSFYVIASHAKNSYFGDDRTYKRLVASEISLESSYSEVFQNFGSRITRQKEKLVSFLEECKKKGNTVFGLGASTKGNVLLQYYDIGEELLPFIGEVNEDKFDKFTPGTRIPIRPEQEILQLESDYLLVLPWHFRDFFTNSNLLKGRNLLFPLPEFEICVA